MISMYTPQISIALCAILGQKFTKRLDPDDSIYRGIPGERAGYFCRGYIVERRVFATCAKRMEKEGSFNCAISRMRKKTRDAGDFAARRAMKRFGNEPKRFGGATAMTNRATKRA